MDRSLYSIPPFIHQLGGSSAVVVFELVMESKALLRLKEEGKPDRLIPPPSRHGLVDGNRRLFAINLEGLEPGRSYSCNLLITPILSQRTTSFDFGSEMEQPLGAFKTLGADRSEGRRIILFQDLHGNWPLLQRASESASMTPDLLIFNGDIVRHAVDEGELKDFLLTGLGGSRWRGLPFHYIRGNHECRGGDAHQLQRYFPNREGRFYYSFSSSGVFFLVLDTGEDKDDGHREYGGLADFDAYRMEQLAWFREELASSEARDADHRLVVMHVPPYSEDEDWHVNRQLQEHWVPAFNEGGVDLVLAGHDHMRGRTLREEWENRFSLLIGDTKSYMDLELKDGAVEVVLRDGESRPLEDSRISLVPG